MSYLYTIPKGKTLRLHMNKQSITGNVPMILEEDIQITLSSKFSPLVSSDETKVINIIGSMSRDWFDFGFSGQFKEMGFQQWTGTDPLSFSPTIAFYMETDAKKDVYDPVLALMSLPLPDDSNITGKGIGLVAPGPSPSTIFGNQASNRKVISMEVGNILRINSVVIKKAEPVWSTETDENGFPISAKINLDISSLYTATVQMISKRPSNTQETSLSLLF